MKRKTIAALAFSAVAVVGGVGALSATAGNTPSPSPSPRSGAYLPAPAASLTDTEKADLAFSRDEERMARDLYQLFANQYDQARPFSNIVRSEQQHFDMIGMMLQRYSLADPAKDKAAGTYQSPEIQKLYDAWAAQGKKSLAEAYKVGVALEKRDIGDLKELIGRTKAADVKQVYTNLLKASENHLAAFTAATEGKTAGMQQGRQGQGRWGQGRQQGQQQGRQQGQQQGPGQGRQGGPGMGFGRTGQRPTDCPMTSTPQSS